VWNPVTMSDRWEYRTYTVHHGSPRRPDTPMKPANYDEWLLNLNNLGEQGWEVVGQVWTYEFNASGAPQLLLKRRL
jgi:hypothetical protein